MTGAGARPRAARARGAALPLLALALVVAPGARAEWLQPDPSYKDAQFALREALHDTLGQSNLPARLDSLAVAHLRLGHFADARKLFERVLATSPADGAARAGMGKLALFADRPADAESLLAGFIDADEHAPEDLLDARLRLGRYNEAAALADSLEMTGRVEMIRRLAAGDMWKISGDKEARVVLTRLLPVPLLRVKLNGESVLMALDPGAGDLLVDDFQGRQSKVELLTSQTAVPWSGQRVTVRNAVVRKLEIGGVRIENVPAGVVSMRKWGLAVNPDRERVAGVIGINVLRRFSTVVDLRDGRLELRPADAAADVVPGSKKVQFEMWGENEMMVYGMVGGGRRMAMQVGMGIPGAGVGAPSEVFEELGIKPGAIARLMKGAGGPLNGADWTPCGVPGVIVGPVARARLSGAWDAMDSGEMWRHGVRRDAVLSSEFFKGLRTTIDWKNRQLLFEGE